MYNTYQYNIARSEEKQIFLARSPHYRKMISKNQACKTNEDKMYTVIKGSTRKLLYKEIDKTACKAAGDRTKI